MTKSKALIIVYVIIVSVFVSSFSYAKTLKIGSILPLSGDYSEYGHNIEKGIKIAIQEIEDSGGVEGYSSIEFYPEDSSCDPRQAVSAAYRLIDREVTGVIGAFCSSSTIPASEVLSKEDIPIITPASTNDKVTDNNQTNVFRLAERNSSYGELTLWFLKNSQDVDELTYDSFDYINKISKDYGIKTKKEKIEYDGVVFDKYGVYISVDSAHKKAAISAKGLPRLDGIKNAFYVTSIIDKDTQIYRNFETKYIQRFDKVGAYAPEGYDAARVLFLAIRRANSNSGEAIGKEIRNTKMQGASRWIQFLKNGDVLTNLSVYRIDNREIVMFADPNACRRCDCKDSAAVCYKNCCKK